MICLSNALLCSIHTLCLNLLFRGFLASKAVSWWNYFKYSSPWLQSGWRLPRMIRVCRLYNSIGVVFYAFIIAEDLEILVSGKIDQRSIHWGGWNLQVFEGVTTRSEVIWEMQFCSLLMIWTRTSRRYWFIINLCCWRILVEFHLLYYSIWFQNIFIFNMRCQNDARSNIAIFYFQSWQHRLLRCLTLL